MDCQRFRVRWWIELMIVGGALVAAPWRRSHR